MKKGFGKVLLLMMLVCVMSVPAMAKWVKSGDSYVYVTSKGKWLESQWLPDVNAGIVKNGKYYYCYKANGGKLKGVVSSGGDVWYFRTGKGRMLVKGIKKINGKYYYFGSDGKMVRKTWVGKRFFGKDGAQVFKKLVGDRFVGPKGKYVTGLKKINGVYYYFDKKDGKKVRNTTKVIKNKTYVFDENGKGSVSSGTPNVEKQYDTDPEVDDETLLAAIIYCEAGNQPYYGQLAVGIVITNRMRSNLFANTLKKVVYASQQFEPARTGVLTRVLEGKIKVTESCKKAAAEVLKKYKQNNYKVKNEEGKVINLKDYLFFMTPAAFKRLRLTSKHVVLDGHVFFKNWAR